MRPTHLRHLTYAFTFFVTLSTALVTYTNSNALAHVVPEHRVSLVYTLGFIVCLLTLIVVPKILKNIGDVRATIIFIVAQILTLLGLVFFSDSILFVGFFIVQLVLPALLVLDADVFLEHASARATTGTTRGTYLTIISGAFLISPLIAGFILGNGETYGRMYLLSALVLIPALLILLFSFSHFKDPLYRPVRIGVALRHIARVRELRNICISNLLLRGFYSVMVIFMPLYLHTELHMPWSTIGILFTVMLIPFVLFEYPLGRLADRWFGEKEILAIGFFLMALATTLIPFIQASALVVWGIVLFLTRTGASAIESMNDSYFFKHVDATDTETIALYRMLDPLAYIIAPLLATIVLSYFDMRFIFLALGICVAIGIPVALRLKDTR